MADNLVSSSLPHAPPDPAGMILGPPNYRDGAIPESALNPQAVISNNNSRESVEQKTDSLEKPVEKLIRLLYGARDTRTRMQAAWQLARMKTPRTVKLLITALRFGDESARVFAALALTHVGKPAVEYLISMLDSKDAEVRQKAIWILWKIKDSNAVPALIRTLGDQNPKVRRYAVWALGEIGDTRALEPLLDELDDDDVKARWDAAISLAKFEEPAVETLVNALFDPRPQVRMGAANALGWLMSPKAIEALTKALKDEDPEVRTRAAFALGWIRDPRAVEPLVTALNDQHEEVRMQAATALGWIRDPRAVEPLVHLIEDEGEWLSYAAIEALGDIGSVSAIHPLKIAMRSSNLRVSRAAQYALKQLHRTRAPYWKLQDES